MSTPPRNERRTPVVQPAESTTQTTACAELLESGLAHVLPPLKPRTFRANGKRLGQKASVAQALMRSGFSLKNTAEVLGISPTTAFELKQQDLISPEETERIKKSLSSKEIFLRAQLLDAMPQRFKDAKLSEMAAAYRALKSEHQPSIQEQYNVVINKYDKPNTQAIDITQDVSPAP